MTVAKRVYGVSSTLWDGKVIIWKLSTSSALSLRSEVTWMSHGIAWCEGQTRVPHLHPDCYLSFSYFIYLVYALSCSMFTMLTTLKCHFLLFTVRTSRHVFLIVTRLAVEWSLFVGLAEPSFEQRAVLLELNSRPSYLPPRHGAE